MVKSKGPGQASNPTPAGGATASTGSAGAAGAAGA